MIALFVLYYIVLSECYTFHITWNLSSMLAHSHLFHFVGQERLQTSIHLRLLFGITPPHLCRITPSTPFRVNIDTTRADLMTNYAWRSSTSSGWNALPASVKTSESYIAFGRQIKTLLFKASFLTMTEHDGSSC